MLTGFLYVYVPKGFFPEQDTGFVFGQAEARQDTSFAEISKLEQDFTKVLLTDPAVQGVVGFAGATGGNAAENTARLFIQLKPLAERKVSAQEVIQRLRPQVAQVIGANFFMQAGQDVNVGGRLSKTEYQYTLTDTDTAELNHWAPILQREMQKLPELQDVASDQQIASPHIAIDIDRDAAYRARSIAGADRPDALRRLRPAAGRDDLHVEPPVQGDPGGRAAVQNDPQALGGIYIATPTGARVPLSTIATSQPRSSR